MSGDASNKKQASTTLLSDQFVAKSSGTRAQKKRLFQKLVLAHFDIHSAYETCEVFLERVAKGSQSRDTVQVGMNNPLYLPLLEAIIISYSRPFIDNNSLGVLPKRWFQFENSKFKEAHDSILKYRNELVAHSDHTVRTIQIFSPNANFGPMPKGQKMDGPGFTIRTFWILLGRVQTFHQLCRFQGQRLIKEAMTMLDDLYSGMELPDKAFDLRIDDGL